MPWVNKRGYSPGKRHYFTGILVEKEPVPAWREGWKDIPQHMSTVALCGMPMTGTRRVTDKGQSYSTWGQLSIKENVNLMQSNLCSYCVKRYVAQIRPDLKEAYAALKGGLKS